MSADGELRLEVRQQIGADEVEMAAERSGALMAWAAEGVEYWGRVNNGDGSETVRFRAAADSFSSKDGFLRLSASVRQ